ncbi:MAG: hypothetical protein Q8Q09_22505 [Deltaproteobacteria bacterium]|nr:hypothetical protein [Deltaproteobacteria bacterium]
MATKNGRLLKRVKGLAKKQGRPYEDALNDVLEWGIDAVERTVSQAKIAADVLLVTATQSEFDAVEKHAKLLNLGFEKVQGQEATYFRITTSENQMIAVLKLKSMGSYGNNGSVLACQRASLETGAKSFVLVGTAFGCDESRQQEGDILVSTELHLYDLIDVVDDVNGIPYEVASDYAKGAKHKASEHWITRCREAATSWKSPAVPSTKIHFGKLLSGGARIASKTFRDGLIKRIPLTGEPVIGGEMEAAGVVAVCDKKIRWIVIKGVSDFATLESRTEIETSRKTAADQAARFALEMLNLKTVSDHG